MKKSWSSLFVMLIALAMPYRTTCQVTLTASGSFPAIGNTFSVKTVDSNSLVFYVDPIASTGQTWNYSNWVTGTPAYEVRYLSPSATPYDTSFPTASIAELNLSDTSYTFFAINGNTISKIGTGSSFSGATPYTNAENIFTYPFSFGSAIQTDSYRDVLNIAAFSVTVVSNGTDSIVPFATGTLTLPGGTVISDALCVKRITHELDSAGSFGNTSNDATQYEFYNSYTKYPLLKVRHGISPLSQSPTLTASVLQNPTLTAISEPQASGNTIRLYPNPASKTISIQGLEYANVRVVNMLGNVVTSAERVKAIDVSTLANGLYLLQADGETVGKFTVQH